MTFSTLMVHLQPGLPHAELLQVTIDCASCFEAGVIGVSMCQLMQVVYCENYISADLIDQDRAEIRTIVTQAETEFRTALKGKVAFQEWRSEIGSIPLADYLAAQARVADLVITGPGAAGLLFDTSKIVDVGDFVMRVGRPVLIVPPGMKRLHVTSVVVAWSESRESRRAIADALPFLKLAGAVTVVEVAAAGEIADAERRVHDVVGWLAQHRVTAEALVLAALGDDSRQLDAVAEERNADLLVAGAYGHNRLREWVLGGVTRDLLLRPSRCTFVSH